ncbi:putative polyamine transporter 3 [Phaeomoniella chlamydospora]|uniref:Putative polyamine transporter 3 n=1 Tax=Phaeomoniella chlamydospora TaxID=158046 RepID=A0A0G2EZP4_PHACM|nr:putative polyamine transporter 3 [Phaeomoniella chlamydospora]
MESEPVPKKLSLFRLVLDQARVDDDVLSHHYEGSGTADDPFVVTWIPNDAGNPFNWSKKYRWIINYIAALSCFCAAFASSAFSGTFIELLYHFRTNQELITAGISLFVLGFAVGPLLWAPLSEIFGRQIVYVTTFAGFTVFNAACTGANSIGTLLVFRFFAGAFGSSPFTNAGGVIADIFPASERGMAMGIFSLAPCMGPTLGPFIAGFLGENEGWRWVMGLMAIFSGILWIAGAIFVPETYAPVLLRRRAAALSKRTGKVYKTKVEIETGPIHPLAILKTNLVRPWILLFMEPIVLLLSIYIAIIYGTLYMFFAAYPIVFQQHRGWTEGIGGLPFLGVAIGMFVAIIVSGITAKIYDRHAAEAGGFAQPESRLIGAMIGAIPIPAGIFWFAWTNSPSIHWMACVAAGVPFGFGFVLVFLSVTSYLIDAYTIFAASVLAANAVIRSLFGAAFPLFTRQMYANLGLHWASCVPAFLALICVPFPFILYKYGAAIRRRCIYAAKAEEAMNELREKAIAGAAPKSVSTTPSDGASFNGNEHEEDRSTQEKEPELLRSRSRANTIPDPAAIYDGNPFTIDRVNTNTSTAGLELTRTTTRKSMK